MGLSRNSRYVIAAFLVLGTELVSATAQIPSERPAALPTSISLADLEIRLDPETGGSCLGRCVHYRITIRGDGTVTYEDLARPPVAPRERTVSVDDVVALANAFVRARFFEVSARCVGESFYERQGEQLLCAERRALMDQAGT
jgi:Domain of unknown function (DUF6438)